MANQKESKVNRMEREIRNARGKPLHGNYAGMSVDPKTGEYVRKVVNVGKGGGGSGGASSDRRELQLGSDLDPKSMMKREDMKKGGMAKAYAKGGDVQSESSKLDQKNAEMDKAQEEGFKRYQAEQAKEAKANADSRKSMPSFNFGKPEKKAKGGAIKSSASSRGDGCAQRGKTKGRMV